MPQESPVTAIQLVSNTVKVTGDRCAKIGKNT